MKLLDAFGEWIHAIGFFVAELSIYAGLIYFAFWLWPEGFFSAPLAVWSLKNVALALMGVVLAVVVGRTVYFRAEEIYRTIKQIRAVAKGRYPLR